ncbi:MAG TPA: hypothetical protein VGS28_04065 [Candidatus Saccharimonadales bacterium]|nr:hypothetical protein [Candidatus Saccharimonadales bacterium]
MNPRGIRTSDYISLVIIAVIVAVHSQAAKNSLAPDALTLIFYFVFGLALATRWIGWLSGEFDPDSSLAGELAAKSGPLVMLAYIIFVIWVVFDW